MEEEGGATPPPLLRMKVARTGRRDPADRAGQEGGVRPRGGAQTGQGEWSVRLVLGLALLGGDAGEGSRGGDLICGALAVGKDEAVGEQGKEAPGARRLELGHHCVHVARLEENLSGQEGGEGGVSTTP